MSILNTPYLLDCLSASQYLSGWSSANDETSVFILIKLKKISHRPTMSTSNGCDHMFTLEQHPLALYWKSNVPVAPRLLWQEGTSSHLKCLSFESGRKIHPICKKRCDYPASSDHILRCIGLSKRDLTSDPLIITDFFGDQQPSGADLTYVGLFGIRNNNNKQLLKVGGPMTAQDPRGVISALEGGFTYLFLLIQNKLNAVHGAIGKPVLKGKA
ncbi:hypothetical protein TNCV_4443341 [Trichonephila clavipes]|nr:hypothetical protein TNCV_4443341 [Trichonephila clavipes]